jgi:hypothetical protein
MGDQLFTEYDAWHGGFYELALELGPRSDETLRLALAALWRHPDLDGCFLDRNREPSDQERVQPEGIGDGAHCLGVAQLPNGRRAACGSCVVREEDGSDWLNLYLPTGSLSKAYPVGSFPFGGEATGPNNWRSEVEDWLVEIGRSISRFATFRLGLIGFEVSGAECAANVAVHGIPDNRCMGYLWPVSGRLEYFPRTAD